MLRESGNSRTAWFAGDVERTFWLTGHGDLLRLLHNTIRWLTHDEAIVHVDGDGFIEMFAGRPPRLRRSPSQLHQPQRAPRLAAVGRPHRSQQVRMKLPAGVGVKSVELLKAEHHGALRCAGRRPALHRSVRGDYEVAAITGEVDGL